MGDEGAKQGVVKLIIEKLLAADVVEERVVQYICRGGSGRQKAGLRITRSLYPESSKPGIAT